MNFNLNISEAKLKNYAKLLVVAGGNVQKGQPVVIGSSVDNAFFARMVVDAAYDAGASEVAVWWNDDHVTLSNYLRAADETFDEYPKWAVDRYKHYDDKGVVYLFITSPNPDLLKDVDKDRIDRYSKVSSAATKAHQGLRMNGDIRWSVVALPSVAWAKKVFPELAEQDISKAMNKLLDLLMTASRAVGDNPIDDWKKHNQSFADKLNYLNGQQFTSLLITTGLGTHLTIGLPQNHVWVGGGGKCKDGLLYLPNIPTEEIFTAPDKENVCGKVVASMPLSYQGNLVEDIEMEFANGVITSYNASKNKEILTNIISTDEGSKRLGEIAIVTNSSPISQMGTLFFNTLLDENASAHLAIGKAYPKNIEGGTKMTPEQLEELGINDSLVHVDFMFGTADLQIVGTRADGSEVVFFKDGEYV